MIRRASNPFESSAADWLAMADALHEMEQKLLQSDQHRVKLIAEVEQLEDQLAESQTERKFWMGYAIQIETRLDVITETIQEARNHAREAAKKFTVDHGRPPVPDRPIAPHPQPERPRPRLSDTQKPQSPPIITEQDDDRAAEIFVDQISALHNKWP